MESMKVQHTQFSRLNHIQSSSLFIHIFIERYHFSHLQLLIGTGRERQADDSRMREREREKREQERERESDGARRGRSSAYEKKKNPASRSLYTRGGVRIVTKIGL